MVARGGGLGFVGGCARGDRRAAPVLTAGAHEGEGVGVLEVGDHLLAGREVFRESSEGQIPADAYGARAELVPPLVVDERDVLEPERGVVTRGGEAHLDPRDLAAELPCHREVARCVRTR